MKKSNWETVGRSAIKTVTYRVIIIISTFCISYLITGDKTISLGITSISAVANTILYYLHERFWNVVKWGRRS